MVAFVVAVAVAVAVIVVVLVVVVVVVLVVVVYFRLGVWVVGVETAAKSSRAMPAPAAQNAI